MSFDYDVMSEEEAQKAREFPLLPDGIYDFAVMEAKFKYSGSNNPMIELKLRIIHDGKEFHVFDNLIGIRTMAWKTKHFCDTTGLQKEYVAKKFDQYLAVNRRGTCEIVSVPARPKNNGKFNADGTPEMYKAKNEIKDYISEEVMAKQGEANPFAPPPTKTPAEAPPEAEPFIDSDIPF